MFVPFIYLNFFPLIFIQLKKKQLTIKRRTPDCNR